MAGKPRIDAVWPLIVPALLRSAEKHSKASISARLQDGTAHLWATETSALITAITPHPEGPVLVFWLAGGDLAELVQMHDKLINLARNAGVYSAQVRNGRPGFLRVLDGYTQHNGYIEKVL